MMKKMYIEPQTESIEMVAGSAILSTSEGFTPPPAGMPQPGKPKSDAPAAAI